MFENPVAKRTAIAAAIGAVVAIPLPFIGPILGAPSAAGSAISPRSKIIRELAEELPVQLALEGDDQLGKVAARSTSIRGTRDARCGCSRPHPSQEAREEPILVLADPFPAPQLALKLLGQVVLQPLGRRTDPLDQPRWIPVSSSSSRSAVFQGFSPLSSRPAASATPRRCYRCAPRRTPCRRGSEASPRRRVGSVSFLAMKRHCEERSDEAIQFAPAVLRPGPSPRSQ